MVTLSKFFKFLFLNLKEKNNLIGILIIFSVFFFDRFSKIKAINLLTDQNNFFVNDFINLSLVWNTGIGFGLLSLETGITYNLISALIGLIIFFLIYLLFISKLADKILFALVVGGAFGNLYDRIVFFAVPDFIDVHYQNFHWFTFNIADIFISLGIIMLVLKDLILKK